MRRADPKRIYEAQRAGYLGRHAKDSEVAQRRAAAVLDALEAECEVLRLERGTMAFWCEAERRARR